VLRDLPTSEYKTKIEQQFWKNVGETRKETDDTAED
jgi:hypothetical protein